MILLWGILISCRIEWRTLIKRGDKLKLIYKEGVFRKVKDRIYTCLEGDSLSLIKQHTSESYWGNNLTINQTILTVIFKEESKEFQTKKIEIKI